MFKFRLQRVLELREQHQQVVAGQLAAARTGEERAQLECEALQRARDKGAEHAAAVQARGPTIGQLQSLSYVAERLNDHVKLAEQGVEIAHLNSERCLDEFTTAFRERRVLDHLRERDLKDWQAGEAHNDRQLMDDIALSRFVRHEDPGAEQEG